MDHADLFPGQAQSVQVYHPDILPGLGCQTVEDPLVGHLFKGIDWDVEAAIEDHFSAVSLINHRTGFAATVSFAKDDLLQGIFTGAHRYGYRSLSGFIQFPHCFFRPFKGCKRRTYRTVIFITALCRNVEISIKFCKFRLPIAAKLHFGRGGGLFAEFWLDMIVVNKPDRRWCGNQRRIPQVYHWNHCYQSADSQWYCSTKCRRNTYQACSQDTGKYRFSFLH